MSIEHASCYALKYRGSLATYLGQDAAYLHSAGALAPTRSALCG